MAGKPNSELRFQALSTQFSQHLGAFSLMKRPFDKAFISELESFDTARLKSPAKAQKIEELRLSFVKRMKEMNAALAAVRMKVPENERDANTHFRSKASKKKTGKRFDAF